LEIEEVEVQLRAPPRKVTVVHFIGTRQDNWPNYTHFLLRATHTKTKTKWALDIAGGQFGICNPFWNWEEYVNFFVNLQTPMKVYPSGTNQSIVNELGTLDGVASLTYGLVGDIAKAMDKAVEEFEKNHKVTLAALLKLTGAGYESQRSALLKAMTMAIRNYKQTHDNEIQAKYRKFAAYDRKYPGLGEATSDRVMVRGMVQYPHKYENLSSPSGQVVSGVRQFFL
jgi:hypothetical protein